MYDAVHMNPIPLLYVKYNSNPAHQDQVPYMKLCDILRYLIVTVLSNIIFSIVCTILTPVRKEKEHVMEYRIAGNFRGGKLCGSVGREHFTEC